MADLAITASQVAPAETPQFEEGVAGEAILPGQAVYKRASDSKFMLADADASAAAAAARGVAVGQAAADGQRITVQRAGHVTIGAAASVTVGELYVLSGNPGGIAPAADLASGDYVTVLGGWRLDEPNPSRNQRVGDPKAVMPAGSLRDRLELRGKTTTGRTASGKPIEDWVTESFMSCAVRALSGDALVQAQQFHERVRFKIRTRYRTDVTTDKRLRFGDRIFHIHYVIDPDSRRRWTDIFCEERTET